MADRKHAKRRRLSSGREEDRDEVQEGKECVICLLDHAVDQTILPACSHSQYCFLCIVGWATLPRPASTQQQGSTAASCPLCKTPIGPYVLHHLRGQHDASKYYLRPPLSPTHSNAHITESRRRGRRPQRPSREDPEDSLERTLAFRRRIYSHLVFSKHIASNRYTRWKPLPPPSAFRPESGNARDGIGTSTTTPTVGVSNWSPAVLQSRALAFLRRELLLFPHLNALGSVQDGGQERQTVCKSPSLSFVTTYIFSLLQTLDLRSETMTRLLAEFLCPQSSASPVAELFAHELASWLRSPYRQLEQWDRSEWLQYDFSGVDSSRTHSHRSSANSSRRVDEPSEHRRRTSPPVLEPQQDVPADEEKVPPATTVVHKEKIRDLRARLLNRLESERHLAQAHLETRLAQDPSFHKHSQSSEADAGEEGVDVEKEASLREILRARMAERQRLPEGKMKEVDGGADIDREDLLRSMLHGRGKAVPRLGDLTDGVT
ncbi:hypothetical protein CF327_g164 [Tilletia walkeri]|nr:hypothetical protein CF327_g164 [Tilletia walkeri]